MKLRLGTVFWLLMATFIGTIYLSERIGAQESANAPKINFVPAKSPIEIQMEAKAAMSSFYWWQIFWWGLLLVIILALVGAVWAWIYIPGWKNQVSFFPDESGLLPLIRENKAPIWRRLLGEKDVLESDPNLAIAPTRRVRARGSDLDIRADTHGADLETQARHARGVTDVRKIGAFTGKGTHRAPASVGKTSIAQERAAAGVYDAERQHRIAQRDLATWKIEQKQLAEQTGQNLFVDDLPQYEKIDFMGAMALSRNWSHERAEVVIGQALDDAGADAGELAKIDLISEPMIMISGKRGSGKTKGAAFTIVAAAVQWGWATVVFEPEAKRDWENFFGKHVAYHEMTTKNFDRHLTMIENEYKRRAALLKSRGFTEWNDSEESIRVCPPMLIVLEEFGTTLKRIAMRQDNEEKASAAKIRLQNFLQRLTILVLEARASGLMFLAVQQRPNNYPSDLLSNFKHIVYALEGGGQGSVVNSHRNHLLLGQGHFDMGIISRKRSTKADTEPMFFWSFDTKRDMAQFLMSLPPTPRKHHLAPNGCCQAAAETVSVDEPKQTALSVEPYQIVEYTSMDTSRVPLSELPFPLQRIYDKDKAMRAGKWDRFSRKFYELFEDAQMIELAEAMSLADFGDTAEENVNKRKSTAQRLHERFSPTGIRDAVAASIEIPH